MIIVGDSINLIKIKLDLKSVRRLLLGRKNQKIMHNDVFYMRSLKEGFLHILRGLVSNLGGSLGISFLFFLSLIFIFYSGSQYLRVSAADKNLYVHFNVELYSEVKVGERFTVLFELDSNKNTNILMARLALKYDPEKLELLEVIANTDLFCRYPEEPPDYVTNTQEGVIIVTGYADGTPSCPFVDVKGGKSFVKLVFKAKSAGTADFAILYDGGYENNDVSAVLENGSPPKFVLEPPENFRVIIKGGEYTTPIEHTTTESPTTSTSTPSPTMEFPTQGTVGPTRVKPTKKPSTKAPDTGLLNNWVFALLFGIFAVSFGGYLLHHRNNGPDMVIYK